ncbi:hypothetical protein [Alteraurantiacibacter buctensis]|uniref:Uncharacterized protein n=1 Tax=Alteraurantiacibacter buctensis TaxID=1503981 RepID=A0A844Z0R7_9SPHN|nr:hypothetical protein [Alteraurantiacibacter buctensis]MXO72856.1 hypothetical protein [Alteraurantiacibacter buctensis]
MEPDWKTVFCLGYVVPDRETRYLFRYPDGEPFESRLADFHPLQNIAGGLQFAPLHE